MGVAPISGHVVASMGDPTCKNGFNSNTAEKTGKGESRIQGETAGQGGSAGRAARVNELISERRR